ncbi:flagellar biosynthetic protein FliR, partial [Burkholderia pyrrocinia]
AQLNVWLTAFLWPFVRMLALVATAPVTGHPSVPARVKVGLAAFMALVVAPTLG